MSLLELGHIAFGGTPAIITFLQGKNVLARQKQCSCGTMMEIQARSDISDGYRWRCPDCRKGVSVRKGSFFEKSKNYPPEMAPPDALVGKAVPC